MFPFSLPAQHWQMMMKSRMESKDLVQAKNRRFRLILTAQGPAVVARPVPGFKLVCFDTAWFVIVLIIVYWIFQAMMTMTMLGPVQSSHQLGAVLPPYKHCIEPLNHHEQTPLVLASIYRNFNFASTIWCKRQWPRWWWGGCCLKCWTIVGNEWMIGSLDGFVFTWHLKFVRWIEILKQSTIQCSTNSKNNDKKWNIIQVFHVQQHQKNPSAESMRTEWRLILD